VTDDAAYARNPLVDEAQAAGMDVAATVARTRPAPTLFASGDLPAFTLSGVDPHRLLEVPWQARHAIATTTDQARAEQLLDEYADDPDGMGASFDFDDHAANLNYRRRVDAWLAEAHQDDEATQ
jgi:hypothetical protein